jgi:hypothetical protein
VTGDTGFVKDGELVDHGLDGLRTEFAPLADYYDMIPTTPFQLPKDSWYTNKQVRLTSTHHWRQATADYAEAKRQVLTDPHLPYGFSSLLRAWEDMTSLMTNDVESIQKQLIDTKHRASMMVKEAHTALKEEQERNKDLQAQIDELWEVLREAGIE